MQLDRFTTKSQEALQAALVAWPRPASTPRSTPAHLLAVLLEQNEGVIPPVLRKVGTVARRDPPHRRARRSTRCRRSPPAPASPATSRELLDVLRAAEREAGKLRDEYISTEHLLLALSEAPGAAGDALPKNDVLRKAVDRGPRLAPRHLPEPGGHVRGAREVRPRPHRGGRARASSTR